MKTFNRAGLKGLREELQAALQEVAKRHDIQISVGAARFTDTDCTIKVQMLAKGDGAAIQSKEEKDFIRYANMYGLQPEDLGKEFQRGLHVFRVSGLKIPNRRLPVLATRSDGKVFKFSDLTIRYSLGIFGSKTKSAAE